jgi:putative glutamine amidotransferase
VRAAGIVTPMAGAGRPVVLVTVALASRAADPAYVARRTALYLDAVSRAGSEPRTIDESAGPDERREAFAAMDGLLLSGGADIHPSRYGQAIDGSRDIEPGRDALEAEAWQAAAERAAPVLGICRGLQAVNVFAGGSLTQHVDAHAGAPWAQGRPARHPLRIDASTRIGRLLLDAGFDGGDVNSFHHQGVGPADLARDLIPVGWADSPTGTLVEVLEGRGERWVAAVQCHPERTDSTPPAFERLFAAFVEAAAR